MEEENFQDHIPLMQSFIKAGFASPAEDYVEKRLDLNQLIVKHPASTFFVKVDGSSMQGVGIYSGDILVVDRSLEASFGKIVVALLDGEFTVKRLVKKGSEIYLQAENPDFASIRISKERDFQIWGVVTYVIHSLS